MSNDDRTNPAGSAPPEYLWLHGVGGTAQTVSFGRWPRGPAFRYKLAEIQAVEHDHPALPRARVQNLDPTILMDALHSAVANYAKSILDEVPDDNFVVSVREFVERMAQKYEGTPYAISKEAQEEFKQFLADNNDTFHFDD